MRNESQGESFCSFEPRPALQRRSLSALRLTSFHPLFCVYKHRHPPTHTYEHTHTGTFPPVHPETNIHTPYTHQHKHNYTYTHSHTHTPLIHTCMQVLTHMHTCIHIFTHSHVYVFKHSVPINKLKWDHIIQTHCP